MSPAEEVIKYANMLNTENLSALRSGNISIRNDDGFLITPSGVKYSSLKNDDIVFVSLDGKFEEKNRYFPVPCIQSTRSGWRHIYYFEQFIS